jgi:hypothetical protein
MSMQKKHENIAVSNAIAWIEGIMLETSLYRCAECENDQI